MMKKVKSVKKNIFYDLAMSNPKRKPSKIDSYSSYNDILSKSSFKGTKVYSESNKEGFYYINEELNKNLNYEFSFKWVDGDFITPIIQIREVSNMNIFTSFQKQKSDDWQIFTNAKEDNGIVDFEDFKLFLNQPINKNDIIRLVKKGNNIKIYCAGLVVIDYDVKFNSNFYIGFGGHSFGERFTIFKEVSLKQI